jgi:UDP-GlcNAc:undecaprenyl-phosphate GlcNAc-1-phosphate transferase
MKQDAAIWEVVGFVLGCLLPAALLGWLAVGVVRRWAEPLGLMDKPGYRKVHTTPIPLGGGVGIWFSVATTLLAATLLAGLPLASQWLPASLAQHLPGVVESRWKLWGILAGGTVLMLLGLEDDRRGLKWQWRLAIEVAVATVVVFSQQMQLSLFIDNGWVTGLLSVLWIVGLINAFNMIDNMDGLSGGVAAIGSAMLAGMLLMPHASGESQPQWFVAAMLLVLVGALLGFLVHNRAPAKIFMGDAGAYFVGYWVAMGSLAATYTGYQSATPHAVLAPLCVLAIPLYDMLSVIWIRISEGRSPFEGDKRHFSHRLVEQGWSKTQAVWIIYLATFCCGINAWILPRTDWVGSLWVLANLLGILGLLALLDLGTHRSPKR